MGRSCSSDHGHLGGRLLTFSFLPAVVRYLFFQLFIVLSDLWSPLTITRLPRLYQVCL